MSGIEIYEAVEQVLGSQTGLRAIVKFDLDRHRLGILVKQTKQAVHEIVDHLAAFAVHASVEGLRVIVTLYLFNLELLQTGGSVLLAGVFLLFPCILCIRLQAFAPIKRLGDRHLEELLQHSPLELGLQFWQRCGGWRFSVGWLYLPARSSLSSRGLIR